MAEAQGLADLAAEGADDNVEAMPGHDNETGDSADAGGNEGQGEKPEGQGDADAGPVERPGWLPKNFWDGDSGKPRFEELAKSYTELSKKFSEKHDVPAEGEEYELSLPEEAAALQFDPENNEGDKALTQWFQETCRENGVSKAAAAKLFDGFMKLSSEMMPQPMDVREEMQKLGPNGQGLVDSLVREGVKLVQFGVFGEQELEEYKIAMGTAAGASMMAKLLEFHAGAKLPDARVSAPSGSMPSAQELESMKWATIESGPQEGQLRYDVDPDYRKQIDTLYDKLYGNQPAGTSRALGG